MKTAAIRYVWWGQLCFYVGLIACVILKPQGLTANSGISYYGNYVETILPYIVALLGAAYFTIKTAEQFTDPALATIKHFLTVIGLLVLGIMVTPDSLGPFMDGLHKACGISLFVLELLLSLFLVVKLRPKLWLVVFVGIQLAGGIASLIWLAPAHGYLFESQVVFQLGFGALLVYSLPRLANKDN